MSAAAQPSPDGPMPGRLVLWRHGRTEWNAEGRFQGQLDPPLDPVGREQAARSAAHLARRLSGAATVVVSSDLVRAADTAAALADRLGAPLKLDPRLREHGMGTWEGLTRTEVATRYPDQYHAWIEGRPVVGRGGEEPAAVGERAAAALADLPAAEVAVVVTHGGTAGRLIERLLGLGPDARRVLGPLDNCGWSELAFHGSRWRLLRHNMSPYPGETDRTGARPDRPVDAGATPDEAAPPPPSDADAVA